MFLFLISCVCVRNFGQSKLLELVILVRTRTRTQNLTLFKILCWILFHNGRSFGFVGTHFAELVLALLESQDSVECLPYNTISLSFIRRTSREQGGIFQRCSPINFIQRKWLTWLLEPLGVIRQFQFQREFFLVVHLILKKVLLPTDEHPVLYGMICASVIWTVR